MKLSKADIARLFGDVFYLIREDTMPQTQEQLKASSSLIFTSGNRITWKVKNNSKIALILEEPEFLNRNLTNSLKSLILQAQIAPSEIGFGIVKNLDASFKLDDMPMNIGIFFGGFTDSAKSKLPKSMTQNGKDLFFCDRISKIVSQDSLQEEVITMLKRVKFLINP